MSYVVNLENKYIQYEHGHAPGRSAFRGQRLDHVKINSIFQNNDDE